MGKRKERRLAAMSAAGRRVKLDLFAEPSAKQFPGEMVDKSSNDEIRGDPDQGDHAGVPISPSTSGSCYVLGQNQENPLLLLGQYSDDEVNDDANRESRTEVEGNLRADHVQEGEHVAVIENGGCQKDQEINAGIIKQDVDELDATDEVNEKNVGELGTPFHTELKEADSTAEASASAASVMQTNGDVTDGWKMVMHEESNQYYYWNTLTGETSWEVPDVLLHRMETPGDQRVSLVTGDRVGSLSHIHASISQLSTGSVGYVDVTTVDNGNDHQITNVTDTTTGFMVGKENGASCSTTYDASQAAMHCSSAGIGISYPDVLSQHSFASLGQTSTPEQLVNSTDDTGIIAINEVKEKHLTMFNYSCETSEVHGARLVKYGESLLQRLEKLRRSNESLQRHDWTFKYILEVEIRLSDCKALSCYGSSLLPLWWHTETQLKQIESIIDQQGSLVHDSKIYSEVAGLSASLKLDNSLDSGKAHEPGMKESILSNAENAHCSDTSVVKETTEEKINALVTDAVSTKKLHLEDLETETSDETAKNPAFSLPSCSSQDARAHEEVSENTGSIPQLSGSDLQVQAMDNGHETPASPKIEAHLAEDVDMDVEMEVDEEAPADQPASGNILHLEWPEPTEQPIDAQFAVPQNIPSDSPHEINVPPPPEEEWIPPPPPEDEAIPPPPPPEEPTQSIPPLPCAENVHSFSYSEQYNLAYPVSAYEYYASSMSETPNTTYYAHGEVTHVVEPQPPSYYDPLAANSYAEANPDAVAIEPVVYYDIPVETVPLIPITSSFETSGFYVQSAPASYKDNVSTSEHSVSAIMPTEYIPAHKSESNLYLAGHKPDKLIESGASISVTSQSVGTVVGNGTSSDAISTANVKNQPKVARSKKRTIAVAPTLRSNKKVSSLVDKWKAAKEELHGDEEDEPENAYEVLEKKRQKEIEEWKVQQIASGEAQDNANFLPLGGDWRERVKRRRAEANTQSIQTPLEESKNEKKKPDLTELSKDLPSGWQVYWDESSREVYYGNATTSETTWTRPSR